MPHCSQEYLLMQDYKTIEALYFQRNRRVCMTEWHVWWYNEETGEKMQTDRWRIWDLWRKHHLGAFAQTLRALPWVHTILRRTRCPPRIFNVYSRPPVPVSSVQCPGFQHCMTDGEAKQKETANKDEKEKETEESPPRLIQAVPKKRPGPKLAESQVEKKAKVEVSSSDSGATVPDTTSASSVQRHVKPRGSVCQLLAFYERETTSSASSSSAVAVPSDRSGIPVFCTRCRKFPWKCKCRRADECTPEQEFESVCKNAGVWAEAEQLQQEADQMAESEEQDTAEHPREDLWSCQKCKSMNIRHDLVCRTCQTRRPLEDWRPRDWICPACQNHNYASRWWCGWSACPTNNWTCHWCGNYNYANRKFCNRRVCGRPRPFNFDRRTPRPE